MGSGPCHPGKSRPPGYISRSLRGHILKQSCFQPVTVPAGIAERMVNVPAPGMNRSPCYITRSSKNLLRHYPPPLVASANYVVYLNPDVTKFFFFSFSISVVRFRFSSSAASFLFPWVFSNASRIRLFSKSSMTSLKLIPALGR